MHRPRIEKTLSISGISHDGRGIARDQDKVTFVFGALPNEKVDIYLTRKHRRFDEGVCHRVHEAHPARVVPECEAFGVCGGCQLQHVDSKTQIGYKQAWLEEQMMQVQLVPERWLPALTGDFYGYRQKARLGVRYVDKKESVLVGFREQSSHKIAVVSTCKVLDPRLGEHLEDLKALIDSLEKKRAIPQIEVAMGDTEVALVWRHIEPLPESDQDKIKSFAKAKSYTIYLQPGSVESITCLWPDPNRRRLTYSLQHQGLRFDFHPLDFTQVNASMNQAMVNQALQRLLPRETDTVLDLFCGLGNFSLPLAQRVKRVIGVEGAANMVNRAHDNAVLNGLDNVEFYEADLMEDWAQAPWAQRQYDLVLLDPPRSGAACIIENIERFQARAILYISCNPATWVRDAVVLAQKKSYRLLECGVMDMFPQTAHVETMGLFVR